jgi:hypothetical protein
MKVFYDGLIWLILLYDLRLHTRLESFVWMTRLLMIGLLSILKLKNWFLLNFHFRGLWIFLIRLNFIQRMWMIFNYRSLNLVLRRLKMPFIGILIIKCIILRMVAKRRLYMVLKCLKRHLIWILIIKYMVLRNFRNLLLCMLLCRLLLGGRLIIYRNLFQELIFLRTILFIRITIHI